MSNCSNCGAPSTPSPFCPRCGAHSSASTSQSQTAPFGQPTPPPFAYTATPSSDVSGKKLAAGICGILLGALGIHKFVLGYTAEGLIMLLVSLLTCGFGAIPFAIIGLIEGIIYLTKSDNEFYSTYMARKRGWF